MVETGVKLTVKDRKILRVLFENARTPNSVIGSRTRLSKETVNYRIQRLERAGILVGYNTILNINKIGYRIFFSYIRFRNLDEQTESEIKKHLTSHPNVAQLFTCIGSYDAVIKLFAKDHQQVEKIMKGIEASFRNKIDYYCFDYITEEVAVPFAFLYEYQKKQPAYMPKTQAVNIIKPTDLELAILEKLAKNARKTFSAFGEELKVKRELVKYHVKRMEKEGVILKYRPDTIPKVLGFNWYFVMLKTEQLPKQLESTINTFLTNHPNVTYYYKSIGSSDMQIELRAETNAKLAEVLLELRSILKGVLKRMELLIILDEPKYTYFPQILSDKRARVES